MATSGKRVLPFAALAMTGDVGPLTTYTNRRNKVVFFPRSPPLTPPTFAQLVQRNRFRTVAAAWHRLPQSTRDNWNLAAARANLQITGFNLWTFWNLKRNRSTIATVEHQSGITLL
jgi:hypothetical protein